MKNPRHQPLARIAFTLIELLVVISIIALLLGILIPVLGIAKRNAAMTKESVNLRTIQMAMVLYGDGNKSWYPGLTSQGGYQTSGYAGSYYRSGAATGSAQSLEDNLAYVEATMLEDQSTAPAHWISPGENGQTGSGVQPAIGLIQPGIGTATLVTRNHNSFALLAYGFDATLKQEWQADYNAQAVICASRLMFDPLGGSTLWTDSGANKFRGSVVRGDNSVLVGAMSKDEIKGGGVGFLGLLKYGPVAGNAATSADVSSGVIGIFGKSTSSANFSSVRNSGTFTKGLIGSAND